jgi:hypothetical protein
LTIPSAKLCYEDQRLRRVVLGRIKTFILHHDNIPFSKDIYFVLRIMRIIRRVVIMVRELSDNFFIPSIMLEMSDIKPESRLHTNEMHATVVTFRRTIS